MANPWIRAVNQLMSGCSASQVAISTLLTDHSFVAWQKFDPTCRKNVLQELAVRLAIVFVVSTLLRSVVELFLPETFRAMLPCPSKLNSCALEVTIIFLNILDISTEIDNQRTEAPTMEPGEKLQPEDRTSRFDAYFHERGTISKGEAYQK
jgi:hypothetical protein